MRLRNVKNKEIIMNNSKYLINDYQKYQYPFKNNNPLSIEIGMGKGDFLIGMAKKYPNINFIGIEKYDSVVVRALQKLESEDIDNLMILKMDAKYIDQVFNKCVDTIYLNFSDPWPKDRHQKRRLTHEEFLKRYDHVFKSQKRIIMKTDNRKLFEFSLKSLTDYGYKIKDISLNLYDDNYINNIPTEYEIKFKNKGFIIYMVEVTK